MLKSTEGISFWFILIWLAGDACNFFGGILQGVLLTMVCLHVAVLIQINLAGYYCLCDFVLIWQWWYYGKYYRDGKPIFVQNDNEALDATEQTSLLHSSTYKSKFTKVLFSIFSPVLNYFDQLTSFQFAVFKYTLTSIFILITGGIAYVSADSSLAVLDVQAIRELELRWDAQSLGWLSAVLYISSRIPQIFKNRYTKCAGLSLALFVFAVGGNVSYVLSILLKDHSMAYVIENASWIAGSVGTCLLN